MMNLNFLRIGVIVVSLLGLAFPAAATPLLWNLSGVTFSDGGTASGSFTFDAATGIVSSWSISVVGGTNALLPSFTYNPATSQDSPCSTTNFCFDTNTINAATQIGDTYRDFGLETFSPLTDAGGTLTNFLVIEMSCVITNISSPTNHSETCNTNDHESFSGVLTAAGGGGSVPEPASVALMGLAFAALCLSRCRNAKQAAIA
jgi:hypothetical protein